MSDRNSLLHKYLEKLQEKFDEANCWKGIIDDLQEGIILFDKNFKVLYRNMITCNIFGLNAGSEEEQALKSEDPNSEQETI